MHGFVLLFCFKNTRFVFFAASNKRERTTFCLKIKKYHFFKNGVGVRGLILLSFLHPFTVLLKKTRRVIP